MNSTQLVELYQSGALTANHVVVQTLQMIDPANPALVLTALPPDIRMGVLKFAREYGPDGMTANYGIVPTRDQIDAAKKWIEDQSIPGASSSQANGTDWEKYQMDARELGHCGDA